MARYAYWRNHEGRPYKGTDSRHSRTNLLNTIAEKCTKKGDGVFWELPSIDIMAIRTALLASIHLQDHKGRELSEEDAKSLAWKVVIELLKESDPPELKPSKFFDRLNKLVGEFLRQDEREFIYLTSLSVPSSSNLGATIDGCKIEPEGNIERYELPRVLKLKGPGDPIYDYLQDSTYTPYRVSVRNVSFHGGELHAVEALDLFRGLCNLFLTFEKKTLLHTSAVARPLGVVHKNPISTIHCSDGSPAFDCFWYDPDLPRIKLLAKLDSKVAAAVNSDLANSLEKLDKLPYREQLCRLIRRYGRALEQDNLDVAYLRLWGVLESVTGTVGAAYDTVIERTLWHYNDDDRAVEKELLEFLRFRRNRYVHGAESPGDWQVATEKLKEAVDIHLVALLFNDFEVETIDEYSKFLDLPTSRGKLEKELERVERAIKLRGHIKPPSSYGNDIPTFDD